MKQLYFDEDIKFKRNLLNKITIQNNVFSSVRESLLITSLISWILLRQENFDRAELITIIAIAYKISRITASIIVVGFEPANIAAIDAPSL